jgi:hypothetical protein
MAHRRLPVAPHGLLCHRLLLLLLCSLQYRLCCMFLTDGRRDGYLLLGRCDRCVRYMALSVGRAVV